MDSREQGRLARFLARHAVTTQQAVEADVAPYRGMSPADSWRVVEALSRDAALQLSTRTDRAAIAAERDPPHPSYAAIMARLRSERRAREQPPGG